MASAQEILTVKRLKGEIKNLERDREYFYQVIQDENNNFEFYFMLKGDDGSDYKGGYYMGKIVLPKDYPKTPGDFYMLTPSGRFSVNSKICLTNSGYHKEDWSPIWNIKNMVIGFVSIFLDDSTSGISHIKENSASRKTYANKSQSYNSTNYANIVVKFDQFVKPDGTFRTEQETKEFVDNLKAEREKKKEARKTKIASNDD